VGSATKRNEFTEGDAAARLHEAPRVAARRTAEENIVLVEYYLDEQLPEDICFSHLSCFAGV